MSSYTYHKPAGIYPEKRIGRYRCDVAGCDHFATWQQISGPDHAQELRWLCQMHKGLLDDEIAETTGDVCPPGHCDAEYCPDPETCTLPHWHSINCQCPDCLDLDHDDD